MRRAEKRAVLIAGPTASGKSALALRLAGERDGVIINADSMQVYAELRILTARPSPEDEAAHPHRLYGHVPAAEAYSVARWLEDVAKALEGVRTEGRVAIIVGGTGLYFKALTEGLSPMPQIPEAVRLKWRERAQSMGAEGLHRVLAGHDPLMASRLAPRDRQRVTRALEVIDATGRSIAEWQEVAGEPVLPLSEAECLVVRRPRAELQARSDRRLDAMVAEGALDEVGALLAQDLSPELPAMRALGVKPLVRHLLGELSLDDALAQAKLETRQYVKRQETWLNRHMRSWNIVQ